MSTALPTYDQISQLPIARSGEVESSYIDENGHMNIAHYFELTTSSLWADTRDAGVDPAYIHTREMSLFTVEQHIRYLGEMRLGDRLTVHNRFIARTGKALHAMSFLVDQDKSRLACTMEVTWVHVDMQTRRAVDFPEDVAGPLDDLLAIGAAQDWTAPLSGAMGVR